METIETYVAAIQTAQQVEWNALKYWMPVPVYSIITGKRFHKVVRTSPPSTGGSAHCFVEISTGDIYKPASWNAPAKGVRGNIQNEKRPLLCVDYYR